MLVVFLDYLNFCLLISQTIGGFERMKPVGLSEDHPSLNRLDRSYTIESKKTELSNIDHIT